MTRRVSPTFTGAILDLALRRAKVVSAWSVVMGLSLMLSACVSTQSQRPRQLGAGMPDSIAASSLDQSRGAPLVPDDLMQISRAIKRNFLYSNNRPMVWPPVTNLDGIVVGNCMTYSRMVQARVNEIGMTSRFRNVLAPVFPREHVVTVVTDSLGLDWVFDNRRPRPFSLNELSRYYDFEPGTRNAYVGAQRRVWRSVKTANP